MKKLNGYVVIILLVVLIIPSVALASWWNPSSWHWYNIFNIFSKPQTSVIQQNQNVNQNTTTSNVIPTNSAKDLAKKVMTAYLESKKCTGTNDINSCLVNYKIEDSGGTISGNCIRFWATYSVQSKAEDGMWIAGNGTEGEANWVLHKYMGGDAIVNSKSYSIYAMGTSVPLEGACGSVGAPVVVPIISSTHPTITVISPKGGETWQIGTRQTIRYSVSSNMPLAGTCVDSFAVDANGSKTPLTEGVMLGSGSRDGLNFQLVPDNSGNIFNGAQVLPGTYKIELDAHFCAETNNTFITSTTSVNSITVTAASSSYPSITVTSPNGGENWKIGETHNITWNVSQSFKNQYPKVTITLIAGSAGQAITTIDRIITDNTGSYSWTIPNVSMTAYVQDYPAGPYTLKDVTNQQLSKIQIEGYPHIGSPMASGPLDNSDNYFTIVAPQ